MQLTRAFGSIDRWLCNRIYACRINVPMIIIIRVSIRLDHNIESIELSKYRRRHHRHCQVPNKLCCVLVEPVRGLFLRLHN